MANRTSPVLRGKYIISNLLNTPPLPPPAVVPELEESAHKDRPSTVREQLERHRANPVCALVPSQHRSGRLRAGELRRRRPVAARRPGKGWRSMRPACSPTARRSMARWRCGRRCWPGRTCSSGTVTEKLLIYALGRGLEPVDMPVVRSVVRSAAAQNYAMQSIVLGIVRSAPFQMRTKLTDTGRAPMTDRADGSEGVAR